MMVMKPTAVFLVNNAMHQKESGIGSDYFLSTSYIDSWISHGMYGHFCVRNFFQHAPSKVATYDIASIIMHCNKVCNSVHTHKVNRIHRSRI